MSFLLFRTFVSPKLAKNVPTIKALAPNYTPQTPNQKLYVESLRNLDTKIVLGVGPAGCGKTLFACNRAVEMLKSGSIQKIVLTRPLVSVEEEIGFLPGNIISKMDPWTRPIFDILQETYSKRDMDTMLQTGVIEISPLAYMRGRTFKNAFIIADEMQNSSPNQMLMVTTRIGTNSKMVITGDLKQSDRMDNNGLYDLIHKLKSASKFGPVPGIELVEMNTKDVRRSEIVSTILNIYNPNPVIDTIIAENTTTPKYKSVPPPPNMSNNTIVLNTKRASITKMDSALIPKDILPKSNFSSLITYTPPEHFYC
jgi:phosphate starvation-inducible PhoH-like protein